MSAGVNFGDLVARYRALTSVTPEEAEARINQASRRFARHSKAVRRLIVLGPTVSGTATYALDATEIIDLPSLRVNGFKYERVSIDEIDDIVAGRAYLSRDQDGCYAPDFEDDNDATVRVWPTPTVTGQTIRGRAAVLPDDMADDDEYPPYPPDFHECLIDGAFAIGLGRDDEQFADRAGLLGEFDAEALRCGAAIRNRLGGGPLRLAITR